MPGKQDKGYKVLGEDWEGKQVLDCEGLLTSRSGFIKSVTVPVGAGPGPGSGQACVVGVQPVLSPGGAMDALRRAPHLG